jgi:hypothetical protein
MEIFFLNKYVRKFKRYFIISILFYLIVSNDLVFGKGGGKGGKSGGSSGGDGVDIDVGTSKNKIPSNDKNSSTSYKNNSSKSSWVFFYYSGNGQRFCGNLCILTAVLIPTIILLIVGCGIWKCYRIKKRNKSYKTENRIEADENSSHTNSRDSYGSNTLPPVASPYTSPYSHPPTYYPYTSNDYNLDGNYTNYAPGHIKLSPPPMELNQVKSSSRRESFDSMEEVRKK